MTPHATDRTAPTPALDAPEAALRRAEWQPILFAARPLRSRLLNLNAPWPLAPLRVRVHRNHAFEHVASAARPYLEFAGWRGEFRIGDYDDSLNFAGASHDEPADAEIVWLDFDRYAQAKEDPSALAEWLAGRLAGLRAVSPAPILVLGWGGGGEPSAAFHEALGSRIKGLPGVRLCDPSSVAATLGNRYFDDRAAPLSGTRLSDPACVLLARELACKWLPASLRPRIKALTLDLDHTLYRGVLGEDGAEGVELTPAHAALQEALVALRSQGLFLALISRNRPEDVEALFAKRTDFPLKWEHFSATAVGWGEKADGIIDAAKALRIGIDAVAFVDDNPGELAAVVTRLPSLHTIHAEEDAAATDRAIEHYPGLWAWAAGEADTLRVADLAANAERAKALEQSGENKAEYLRSLQVRLDVALNPRDRLTRLVEMSQKTNQFNLNLRRVPEVEMAARLDDPESRVATIRLRDRLSDSGVIGLICARREGDALIVDELCVSCRALGRDLEDLMIGEPLRWMLEELPADRVEFEHKTGPRNEPARDWLAKLLGRPLSAERGRESVPAGRWSAPEAGLPVEIHRESPDAA